MRLVRASLVVILLCGISTFAAQRPVSLPTQIADAEFSEPTGDYPYQNFMKHNAIVSAFYLSNVEYYLAPAGGGSDETLQRFYANAVALPMDTSSLFIRFVGSPQAVNLRWWRGGWLQAVSPMVDLRDKIKAGAKPTYAEALQLIPDPKTLAR